jgi:hypothetical protein
MNPVNYTNIQKHRRVVKHNLRKNAFSLPSALPAKLDKLGQSLDGLTASISLLSNQMTHNVLAVTDVFLRPIRKNAEHFYGRKKMWRNKTVQRAIARTRFCVA